MAGMFEQRADGRRIAVYLDLENLLYDALGAHTEQVALAELGRALAEVTARGTIVTAVGSCAVGLWPRLAFALDRMGVRVFSHHGGQDAADLDLIARARRDLPPTVDTVVLGSGDHIFRPLVDAWRARGRRVELIGRMGAIDTALYRAVDACRVLAAGVERCG